MAKDNSNDVNWYVVVCLRAQCASLIQISCNEIQTSQRLKFKIQTFFLQRIFVESHVTFLSTAKFTYAGHFVFVQSTWGEFSVEGVESLHLCFSPPNSECFSLIGIHGKFCFSWSSVTSSLIET